MRNGFIDQISRERAFFVQSADVLVVATSELRYLKFPVSDVGKVAGDGCRRRHHRTDQVGASAASLAAFKVAVAGGGAAFAGLQDVGVHAQAHGAA